MPRGVRRALDSDDEDDQDFTPYPPKKKRGRPRGVAVKSTSQKRGRPKGTRSSTTGRLEDNNAVKSNQVAIDDVDSTEYNVNVTPKSCSIQLMDCLKAKYYSCAQCGYLADSNQIIRHVNQAHGDMMYDQSYRCFMCGTLCTSLYIFRCHVKDAHNRTVRRDSKIAHECKIKVDVAFLSQMNEIIPTIVAPVKEEDCMRSIKLEPLLASHEDDNDDGTQLPNIETGVSAAQKLQQFTKQFLPGVTPYSAVTSDGTDALQQRNIRQEAAAPMTSSTVTGIGYPPEHLPQASSIYMQNKLLSRSEEFSRLTSQISRSGSGQAVTAGIQQSSALPDMSTVNPQNIDLQQQYTSAINTHTGAMPQPIQPPAAGNGIYQQNTNEAQSSTFQRLFNVPRSQPTFVHSQAVSAPSLQYGGPQGAASRPSEINSLNPTVGFNSGATLNPVTGLNPGSSLNPVQGPAPILRPLNGGESAQPNPLQRLFNVPLSQNINDTPASQMGNSVQHGLYTPQVSLQQNVGNRYQFQGNGSYRPDTAYPNTQTNSIPVQSPLINPHQPTSAFQRPQSSVRIVNQQQWQPTEIPQMVSQRLPVRPQAISYGATYTSGLQPGMSLQNSNQSLRQGFSGPYTDNSVQMTSQSFQTPAIGHVPNTTSSGFITQQSMPNSSQLANVNLESYTRGLASPEQVNTNSMQTANSQGMGVEDQNLGQSHSNISTVNPAVSSNLTMSSMPVSNPNTNALIESPLSNPTSNQSGMVRSESIQSHVSGVSQNVAPQSDASASAVEEPSDVESAASQSNPVLPVSLTIVENRTQQINSNSDSESETSFVIGGPVEDSTSAPASPQTDMEVSSSVDDLTNIRRKSLEISSTTKEKSETETDTETESSHNEKVTLDEATGTLKTQTEDLDEKADDSDSESEMAGPLNDMVNDSDSAEVTSLATSTLTTSTGTVTAQSVTASVTTTTTATPAASTNQQQIPGTESQAAAQSNSQRSPLAISPQVRAQIGMNIRGRGGYSPRTRTPQTRRYNYNAVQVPHRQVQLKCLICGNQPFSTPNYMQLKQHMNYHKQLTPGKLHCLYCSFKREDTEGPWALMSHYYLIHAGKPVPPRLTKLCALIERTVYDYGCQCNWCVASRTGQRPHATENTRNELARHALFWNSPSPNKPNQMQQQFPHGSPRFNTPTHSPRAAVGFPNTSQPRVRAQLFPQGNTQGAQNGSNQVTSTVSSPRQQPSLGRSQNKTGNSSNKSDVIVIDVDADTEPPDQAKQSSNEKTPSKTNTARGDVIVIE